MDYILLHGTGQSPVGWERLVDVLKGRGHRAVPVDFPCDRPGLLADDYARIAATQIGDAVHEPVVVAHSGSGLLLPAVAHAVRARHLVWLAAAVPDFAGGSSFVDQIQQSGPEMAGEEWRTAGLESTEDPVVAAYFGFHDCDLRTVRWAVTTIRLFYPEAAYAETPPARPVMPSTFVLPRHDRTLRPDWMRRVARERLGIEAIEIDGGHFPHVSRPEQLADILVRSQPQPPSTDNR
ncbi:alpha/beta hydrolase [Saccharopolyspora sp. K220]|uniref:alpha/beta fold hydrolase n=1 Tax=Saccharopolyspora soli TaxID=2926618 RepID=UPI001F594E9F|nr:alpha/beta hydrolase [Saccharopolyspora soli]MCI2417861.1 alpha/beta hydrolase [Saccharopolyspora soli]